MDIDLFRFGVYKSGNIREPEERAEQHFSDMVIRKAKEGTVEDLTRNDRHEDG
jgi:hypothetical protein